MVKAHYLILIILFITSVRAFSQELYTARGYWVESTKEAYRKLIQKQEKGDSLTTNEAAYVQDYQTYLANYFNRLSEAEKIKFEQMKGQWNLELLTEPKPVVTQEEEFEWKPRDRVFNTFYGGYYGLSIASILDIKNEASVTGLALITGGLWLMGPAIIPQKYEGITQSTVRAGFTGKSLGLIYGLSLGYMLGGNSSEESKFLLGFSTAGSIALGETFFQLQKKRKYSDGYIEMIRHYGLVGPWISASILLSTGTEDPVLVGGSLLAGGAAGLLIANAVSKRYDYTKGDVDAISTLTLSTTGLGFALMAESFNNTESSALLLIPAAGTIVGTVIGHKIVKGAHLTKKQGSTINLSTGGAALIGLGVVVATQTDSPAAAFAIPSGLALIVHQLLFQRYKHANISGGIEGRNRRNHNFQFSMNITPENYLINQKIPLRENSPIRMNTMNTNISNPIVSLKLKF